jgi:hypothetical protein
VSLASEGSKVRDADVRASDLIKLLRLTGVFMAKMDKIARKKK